MLPSDTSDMYQVMDAGQIGRQAKTRIMQCGMWSSIIHSQLGSEESPRNLETKGWINPHDYITLVPWDSRLCKDQRAVPYACRVDQPRLGRPLVCRLQGDWVPNSKVSYYSASIPFASEEDVWCNNLPSRTAVGGRSFLEAKCLFDGCYFNIWADRRLGWRVRTTPRGSGNKDIFHTVLSWTSLINLPNALEQYQLVFLVFF